MAGEDGRDDTERHEAATPRRLEKAREQGQVALSREAVSFAVLGAGALGMVLALPTLGGQMLAMLRGLLEMTHRADAAAAATQVMIAGLLPVLVVAGLAAAAAVLATLLQTGGLVSAKGLVPRLGKINPLAGFKRLVGVDGQLEFLRSLLKLGLVGAALWWVAGRGEPFAVMLNVTPGGLLQRSAAAATGLLVAALLALALLAVLDLVLVTLRHQRALRMSREEMRQELRETEGDPQIKGRRRQIGQARARQRMMAAVPTAAVVITNPTHYAVALSYARGSDAAPMLVAKGADAVAARIRELAALHRVPIVANPPLARALYRLEPGAEIPPEQYQAVAEVIAYVWRLGRTQTGRVG